MRAPSIGRDRSDPQASRGASRGRRCPCSRSRIGCARESRSSPALTPAGQRRAPSRPRSLERDLDALTGQIETAAHRPRLADGTELGEAGRCIRARRRRRSSSRRSSTTPAVRAVARCASKRGSWAAPDGARTVGARLSGRHRRAHARERADARRSRRRRRLLDDASRPRPCSRMPDEQSAIEARRVARARQRARRHAGRVDRRGDRAARRGEAGEQRPVLSRASRAGRRQS